MPIAIKNSKIDISSEETTKVLAESFKNFLQGGEIIFLYGEMGVGKTTFIKYLVNEFQNLASRGSNESFLVCSTLNQVYCWAVLCYYFLFFGGPSPKLKKMSKFV